MSNSNDHSQPETNHLDQPRLFALLRAVAALWRQNLDRLSEIDSRYGDGDHGVTIGKIAKVIEEMTAAPHDESLKQFIVDLGSAIQDVPGGSASPLYGTFVEGLGGAVHEDAHTIDPETLKAMFQSGLSELAGITKAGVGDKTMLDAIIPAVKAAGDAPPEIGEILAAAAKAAAEGARATERFVAKFGRAKSYGDRTLGTPDVGAVSAALFFQGWHEGFIST